MRAANLMPGDGRRAGAKIKLRGDNSDPGEREGRQPRTPPPRQPRQRPAASGGVGPILILIAVLAGVLIVVAAALLEHNVVNDRKATLRALDARIAGEEMQVAKLNASGTVITAESELAARIQDVAGTRFDWYSTLTGFGDVVTPDNYFKSLAYNQTAAGGAGAAASTSTTTGSSTSSGPAFTLTGCTGSQGELAATMRQLRLIPGVISVNDTTGATGVQLSNSGRPGTSRRAIEGLPTSCSDQFTLSVLFAPPTLEDHGR